MSFKQNNYNSPKITVLGVYPNRAATEAGIRALGMQGFSDYDLAVLMAPTNSTPKQSSGFSNPSAFHEAADQGFIGAASGCCVGAVLGLLSALGAIIIPGFAFLISLGIMAATITGATIGAFCGGITGAIASVLVVMINGGNLKRLAVGPKGTAVRQKGASTSGGIIISVKTNSPDSEYRAIRTLQRTGAEEIQKK